MKITELFGEKQIIAIIGLAKNTGKTVTLTKVMEELSATNRVVGVTSAGRDGEQYDVLNKLVRKPRIFVPSRNLVATTHILMEKSEAKVEVVQETGIHTPLGKVFVGRVLQGGNIEVAGPSSVSGIKAVAGMMCEAGASYVLVDGAFNRIAMASPAACDGFIVATGAILSPDLAVVVRETVRMIDLLRIPEIDNHHIKTLALASGGMMLIDDESLRVTPVVLDSPSRKGARLAARLSSNTRYVVFDKSVVESDLDELIKARKGNPLTIILPDSTKLFISPYKLTWYQKRGLQIRVLAPANILCVTVNPVAPGAHCFESSVMVAQIQKALPEIPVFDVLDQV